MRLLRPHVTEMTLTLTPVPV